MLTLPDLAGLVRELERTKVLTVYHDARVTDPAMRRAWRPALASALRSARARVTDARERAAFDRAMEFLNDPMPPLGGVWGAPGWVAFLTADGPQYAAELPVRPSTLAVWREGPVIAPYLRALAHHRPVIVALVDSRSARCYRYAWGTLGALPEVTLSADDGTSSGRLVLSLARGRSYPAPRAALDTERPRRRRLAAFRRLAASLCALLDEHSGDDGWILIGGTPEWARLAGEAMPSRLAQRVMISEALAHAVTPLEIARAAKRTSAQLRARQSRAVLDRVLEHAGALGRGVVGMHDTRRALRAHAVSLLVVTPRSIGVHGQAAEDAIRAAFAQGAQVEVLSGEAAEHLDRTAEGIAAALRFVVGGIPTLDDTRRRHHAVAGGPETPGAA